MKDNRSYLYPPLASRLFSVWFRHTRVYTKNIFSNGLPPFLEPLLFLAGVGLGLAKYITQSMEGLTYIEFLGTGLLMTSAMFTASFECTFGTFIRMEFEKVYAGIRKASAIIEKLDLKNATDMSKELSGVFEPEFKVALLHGRMKGEEKDAVMLAFREKQFDILVATEVASRTAARTCAART